jgi:hypothetical protein
MVTWKDRREELRELYRSDPNVTLLDVLDLARRETLSDSSMDSYAQGRTEGLRRSSAQGLSSAEKEIAELKARIHLLVVENASIDAGAREEGYKEAKGRFQAYKGLEEDAIYRRGHLDGELHRDKYLREKILGLFVTRGEEK